MVLKWASLEQCDMLVVGVEISVGGEVTGGKELSRFPVHERRMHLIMEQLVLADGGKAPTAVPTSASMTVGIFLSSRLGREDLKTSGSLLANDFESLKNVSLVTEMTTGC